MILFLQKRSFLDGQARNRIFVLRLYFVISTSIGSTSPRNSRRTRTRRFFVSIDNSVISPIPFSLLLTATRAVNASVASFERRRNVRTSPGAAASVSSRWRTFLNDRVSCHRDHYSNPASCAPHLSPPARTPPLLWRVFTTRRVFHGFLDLLASLFAFGPEISGHRTA